MSGVHRRLDGWTENATCRSCDWRWDGPTDATLAGPPMSAAAEAHVTKTGHTVVATTTTVNGYEPMTQPWARSS